jgi:DNA repair protein RadA/Sms
LVGHITKDGNLAGPKVLEHMVDYVLYLEEENTQGVKTLKAVKNRFGSIYESGLFRMTAKGLVEVSHPNKSLLLEKTLNIGTSYFPMMNGNRTLLIEIQALVGKSPHPASLKTAIGIEKSKLLLLLAVLDKYLNINLLQTDVYLNIAGGYRCNEPAIDLSILAAILSSYSNKTLPAASVFLGEIALTGKLTVASSWKDRMKEVERCGFEKAFLGKVHSSKKKFTLGKLQVLGNNHLTELMENLEL